MQQSSVGCKQTPRSDAGPRVLILDSNRWPVTARLAIALYQRNCRVAILCPSPRHPVETVSSIEKVFLYSGFDPVQSIRSAIESFRPDLVVPACDRSVRHLHRLHAKMRAEGASGDSVANLIEYSLGSPESFAVVASRYELLKLAMNEGIPVPATMAIDASDDLEAWKKSQPLPWVLKADGTWGGRGVRVVSTPTDADCEIAALVERPGSLELCKRVLLNRSRDWILHDWFGSTSEGIAQAMIDGRPANCAVVCWQGKILAGIAVEVIGAQSKMGPSTIVRIVEGREMLQAAERIASRLKLSGFFGLDFMIENQTGAVYLIEMNPRCTPPCSLALGQNRDLAAAITAQLCGEPVAWAKPVTVNDRIAWFPQNSASSEVTHDDSLLHSAWLDVPAGEPALVHELLHPWCERSFLGSAFDFLRRPRNNASAGRWIYEEALRDVQYVCLDGQQRIFDLTLSLKPHL